MSKPKPYPRQIAEFDLAGYLSTRQKLINGSLEKMLDASGGSGRILDAMKYSLMAGGKRIRPILTLAAAESVGGAPAPAQALSAACAVEMIHTYSLIHDDLPAMDDDELRRGKPTCHVAFDEATAILAGDALLTLAFEILSSIDMVGVESYGVHLSVIRTVAKGAGCFGMIEGQIRDMGAEGRQLSLMELEEMHTLKTGALIEAAVRVGALLGGGSATQIENLGVYARNIGLAFQVTDDILNVVGDPSLLGKAVGTDDNRQKNTYPSLLGLDRSREFAEELVNKALQALDIFDNKSDPLRAIAGYITRRKI